MQHIIERLGDYNTGFRYIHKDNGKEITDIETLSWIKGLKIPPAYTSVKINSNRKSKILAIGYDTKGRKQYIYNPKFIDKRSQQKYNKIIEFNHIFTAIKEQVDKDINSKDETLRDIAVILYLIMNCGFRVGNKSYEKQNGSFGISTIYYKHLKFNNGIVCFDFIGKKGVRNIGQCSNPHIYKILREKIKQNVEDNPVFPNVSSKDVNTYLKKFHESITTKDLRTWNANIMFITYAKVALENNTKNPIKKAIEQVSQKLHNTVAVCKKNYIDPDIVYTIEKKIKK